MENQQNASNGEVIENDKEASRANGKGAGNIGLPFGLCKKLGIILPENATPRDAWDAINDAAGISPDEVYTFLQKGGEFNKQKFLQGAYSHGKLLENLEKEKGQAKLAPSKLSEETLPDLVGSEKQTTWAKDIRSKFLSEWNKVKRSNSDEINRVAKEFEDEFFKETSARTWIDRRYASLVGVIRKWMQNRNNK